MFPSATHGHRPRTVMCALLDNFVGNVPLGLYRARERWSARCGHQSDVAEEDMEEMDEEMVDALDALDAEGAAEQTNTRLRKLIVAGHWIELVSPVICHGDVGLAVYFVSMVDDD